jgi:hypothetical protein
MMRTLLILSLFLTVRAAGQGRFTNTDFSRLSWLEGSWKGIAQNAAFYEAWRRVNDSTFLNLGIEIANADTTISESTTLRLRGGSIFLGDKGMVWTASRLVANELVLRNDTARSSNTIIWMHGPADHWITVIEHPKTAVFYDMTRDAALDRKVDAWIRQRSGR